MAASLDSLTFNLRGKERKLGRGGGDIMTGEPGRS